jgi:hypothetical protein
MAQPQEGFLQLNSFQPASLVRALKAEAARREMSSTAAVQEALRAWLKVPQPAAGQPAERAA